VTTLNPVVDICFIHGLSGNLQSTWRHRDAKEPWPKTILPQEFPELKARIIIYGYDAYCVHLRKPVPSNNIHNHAEDFMIKITQNREKAGILRIPLILVCHSLGGILVKHAVPMSKNSATAGDYNLYDKIDGIIFMETPHKCSWTATLAKTTLDCLGILKRKNTGLLRLLRVGDAQLEEIHESFMYIRTGLKTVDSDKERPPIRTFCLYETLPTTGLGFSDVIVDSCFATLPTRGRSV
jgi:hypothetical protein